MAFASQYATVANLANSIKRVYDPEFFELAMNVNAPFYKMILAAKNIEADGDGYYWPFYLSTPQNMGSPAEMGAFPPIKQRIEVQGRIRPVQFANGFQISFIMEAIGTDRGSFGKAEVKRQINEAVVDTTKHMNRIMAGTHGSGRLGQIETGGTGTTFILKAPQRGWLVKKKMLADVYTLDTGGVISSAGAATQLEITDVNPITGAITFGTSVTLAANEHVYNYPDYNNTANGLLGLVDDGTYLTSIHNQSRSTYPDLKATILGNSGTRRPLVEEYLIDMASLVLQNSGEEIDTLIMNSGQIRQYLRLVNPQRRYSLDGGKGVPEYKTGYRESDLQFLWGNKTCPIQRMEDILPSMIFGISKRLLRRTESRKLDWFKHGNGMGEGGILAQAIDQNGYITGYKASLFGITNIMNLKPNGHGAVRDLLDPQMLADASE